jgi:hypothetical protein
VEPSRLEPDTSRILTVGVAEGVALSGVGVMGW